MIIAISTTNSGHFTETPTRLQNAAYCQYVADCGFTPILVPLEANPEIIADMADGLLLPGGIDIDPMYYDTPNNACFSVDPERDGAERALLHTFVNRGKRVFGICRGMQLIAYEFMHELGRIKDSSAIYFDYIQNVGAHTQTTNLHVPRQYPSHFVNANMGGLMSLGKNTQPERLAVNSMHHQAFIFKHGLLATDTIKNPTQKIDFIEPSVTSLRTPIGKFRALAWTLRGVDFPKDASDQSAYWSILEAFSLEIDNGSKLLAVQWHPEEMRSIDMLKNFFLAKNKKTEKPAVTVAVTQ